MSICKRFIQPPGAGGKSGNLPLSRARGVVGGARRMGDRSTFVSKSVFFGCGCGALAILFALSFFILQDADNYAHRAFSTVAKSRQPMKVMAVPFQAYKVDEAGDTQHRSCKTTIIVHGKESIMKWSDSMIRNFDIADIPSFSELKDDMMCLQVGQRVAALVSGEPTTNATDQDADTVAIIGSDKTIEIIQQVFMSTKIEIVARKSIVMSGWYQPSTHDVRVHRMADDNSGNFIWQYGATRLINPYTTKFFSPEDAMTDAVNIEALVAASANSLHLPNPDGWAFQVMKGVVDGLSNLVKKVDRPTILLGIGIQAEFSDIEDRKKLALHPHQAHLMNEIAMRNTLEKSVAVRGDFTETACINAGVHNCVSLGCPSLSISREHNLGRVLESRWNDVDSKLANEKINLKIGIALPAIPHDKIKYAEVVDLLLAICEKHDCHFIVQAPYDRNLLLKHAGDMVDETNIHHFSDGVETWFQFMDQLDFVVSTRIHGGMAGIINRIPTIIIPTDIRIFELINAMKLPHIDIGDVINKNATSLQALMGAAKKNFTEFEKNRVDRLRYYKRMLESIGLMMDPHLLDVIDD